MARPPTSWGQAPWLGAGGAVDPQPDSEWRLQGAHCGRHSPLRLRGLCLSRETQGLISQEPNQCPISEATGAEPQVTGHQSPHRPPCTLQPSIRQQGHPHSQAMPTLSFGPSAQKSPREAQPHSPPRGPRNSIWNLAAPVSRIPVTKESAISVQHLQIIAILKQANKRKTKKKRRKSLVQ